MRINKPFKLVCFIIIFILFLQYSGFPQVAAQLDIANHLSVMRNALIVDRFRPLHLRYLEYNPKEDNFRLLIDKGAIKNPSRVGLENTSKNLLKYFFIGLTLPDDFFWVNLRPDSPDNIINPLLAQTDVGRIFLEADLELKKDAACFTSPVNPEGKKYWDKLYQKAEELFGSQDITIPTLTRPWIVPDEIIIRETSNSAYIYKATLKVMLEQDHLKDNVLYDFKDERLKKLNEYSSQLIRELIIPKLTKDINTAKKYAPLRQVYYSLILAQWFKARNKNKRANPYSFIIDCKDLTNLALKESYSKDTYFKAYQKSFKDGEYSFTTLVSTPFRQVVRSYFSGGIQVGSLVSQQIGVEITTLGGGKSICMPAQGQLPQLAFNEEVYIQPGLRDDIVRIMEDKAVSNISERDLKLSLEELEEKYEVKIEVLGQQEFLTRASLFGIFNPGKGFGYYDKPSEQAIACILKGNENDRELVIQEITEALSRQAEGALGVGSERGAIEREKVVKLSFVEATSQQIIFNILLLEGKLKDQYFHIRQTAIKSLALLYAKLIEKGEKISLSLLEDKLKDPDPRVRQTAIKSLAFLYAKLIERGEKVSLSSLEDKLKVFDSYARQTVIKSLAPLYTKLIEKGEMTLSLLEDKLKDQDPRVRQTAIEALAPLYAKLIERGEKVSLSLLEDRLKDEDFYVCQVAIEALAPLYAKLIEKGEMTLSLLEDKLKDQDPRVRQTAIEALAPLYAKLIERGEKVSLSLLEDRLKDEDFYVCQVAIEALASLYTKLIERGEKVSLSLLEDRLKDEDPYIRQITAKSLAPLYAKLIERGEKVFLSLLEDKLKVFDSYVRQAVIEALAPLYTKLIEKGEMTLSLLEDKLKDKNPNIRRVGLETLLLVYTALIEKGEMTLSLLEDKLKDQDPRVRQTAIEALAPLYAKLIERGEKVSLSLLEDRLKDEDFYVCQAVIEALAPLYAKLIEKGEMTLSLLEDKLKVFDSYARQTVIKSLAPLYTKLIEKGEMTLSLLEDKLKDQDPRVRQTAIEALAPLYAKLIERGEKVSLSLLEDRLKDEDFYVCQVAVEALAPLYAKLIEKGGVLSKDCEKYKLWQENNLPFREELVKDYFSASDSRAFILKLKLKAENMINSGFDYNNEEEVWLAYLGLEINGIDVTYEEFKERINKLIQFDKEYPGYFKNLFTKAAKPIIIELNSQGVRIIDTSSIDLNVFNQNLDELIRIRQRIDSLSWINEDFPQSKVFNIQNLYYLLKRQEAIDKGLIKEGERFRVEYPQEEVIKQELLSNRRKFYKIIFSLVKDRLGEQDIGRRCLFLMRDLIISDIMLEEGLLAQMFSHDQEVMVTAFKNFYEDYKHHLPNSLSLNMESIKGLAGVFQSLTSKVYKEISKVRVIKQEGVESYRLIEQGFLGVFRGRAGIIDCSFDTDDKGNPYTRAMHEDTKYFFVYKGKALKGYIGLMVAKDYAGDKVLTIDTINSPSLDGEELLMSLFKVLYDLAIGLGCSGIALPGYLGPSFNFGNKETISLMDIYKEGLRVSLKPLHEKSWDYFTRIFGKDTHNSIEDGKFVMFDIDRPRPRSTLKEDYTLNGRVAKEDVEAIAEIAALIGARRIVIPKDIISTLEQKFGFGRIDLNEIIVVPEAFMVTRFLDKINGPVRLGDKVFIGDSYFFQHNNDLRSIIAGLSHEVMAGRVAQKYPGLNKDTHDLAKDMEDILRIKQGSFDLPQAKAPQEGLTLGVGQNNMGGIDFTALPVVVQAISNLSANISHSSLNNLSSINLNQEWQEIERMVNAGIIPSSQRIKEYIQASCIKGQVVEDADKVISCISGILREEEEHCQQTELTLKDILVVLQINRSIEELREVFLGKR